MKYYLSNLCMHFEMGKLLKVDIGKLLGQTKRLFLKVF